jgi:hypothetical protein
MVMIETALQNFNFYGHVAQSVTFEFMEPGIVVIDEKTY